MKTLPETFRADGFDFRVLKRDGNIALLEKSKPNHHQGRHFEVVIVQAHPEHKWPNGDISPERETMPSNESWGTLGWTYCDASSANRRFDACVGSQ